MKVGDRIPTWFSDRADGLSTILAIEPYRGQYPQWFTHSVKVTAPRTRAGHLWMTVNNRGVQCS